MERRNFLKFSLSALPVLAAGPVTFAAPVKGHRLLCCNIRVALDEDEEKGVGWSSRKDICLKIIAKRKPDIICLQEVLKVQSEDFKKYFKDFQLIGFDGPEMDPHPTGYYGIAKNPILFSKKRYELLTAGTYWLSETPLVAGSKSWDTARARHVNWVRLKEISTGKEFRVVNLHLDHVSADAKLHQLNMVVEESLQYDKEFPQIIAGDFNSRYRSNVFTKIREEGWKDVMETLYGEKEMGFTGHAFKGAKYEMPPTGGRIDFIWFRGKVKPLAAEIVRDEIGGVYPSDHFFVQSDLIVLS